jgi:hypothetical protein
MGFIGRVLAGFLARIAPYVLKAWVNIMRDEVGKFYATHRDVFIEGVRLAESEDVEIETDGGFWERRRRQAKIVLNHVCPALLEAGVVMEKLPLRFLYAAIEAAVTEVKGGWVK